MKQQSFENLKKGLKAYGGKLRNKACNRHERPLVFRSGSMHISLKSTKAMGRYSFQDSRNRARVKRFIEEFSTKKGVLILSMANVGNHLHLHVKLHNRDLYIAWIRGLTSGLAMMVMGLQGLKNLRKKKLKFWDQRPFSRVIENFKHFLTAKKYLEINQLEGLGLPRVEAELLIYGSHRYFKSG